MRRHEVFVMPFGPYQGSTLMRIYAVDDKYLQWAAHNYSGEVQRKIVEFLGKDLEEEISELLEEETEIEEEPDFFEQVEKDRKARVLMKNNLL
jgi:hypothetical protein